MTGVVVTTATRSGPTTPLRSPSGQFFVSGITERGDTAAPILLRSMTDYAAKCGVRTSYGTVYDQLKTFFDEGGSQAYVARVVGGSASVGLLTLQDRAGVPLNTLRVDAQNAGAWSSGLTVEVQNGSLADTFRIIVKLNGETVEDWNNLANPAAAVLAASGSVYVRITDLGSATVAPNNNPKVLAATALSAGNDQRGSVVAADYVTALTRFSPELGDGAVAIPGQTTGVYTGINDHCKANNRVGILAATRGASTSTLASNAATIASEYVGLFAPWVQVDDGAGGIRTVSPEGYIAGVRARAHDQVGPWRAPAGEFSVARTLLGLDQVFTQTESDSLDSARVSPIRQIANSVRLYGWRSLSADEGNYFLLKDRDFLNHLVVNAKARLEKYVFNPIDSRGRLFAEMSADLVGLLDPFRQNGGLYAKTDPLTGDDIDPGYSVVTDSRVNTPETAALNKVYAQMLVRISPTGQFINLTVVKVGILAGI